MNKKYSFRIEYRYDGGRIVREEYDYNDLLEIKEFVNAALSKFDKLENRPMTADVILVDREDNREKTYLYYNFQTGKIVNYF